MARKKAFQVFRNLVLGGVLLLTITGAATAARQAGSKQQPATKHRTSLIYATSKGGTPAVGLTAADLVVKLAGNPIPDFTLTESLSQNKLIFLVFDTASMSSNLLSRSKRIAQSAVSQASDGVRFVVMSIDPGAGLRPVCGPTPDKDLVSKSIAAPVTSRSDNTLRRQATDKQDSTLILASLRTLSAVLGRFPESDKVVHFYSGGISQRALVNRTHVPHYLGYEPSPTYSMDVGNFASPDTEIYDKIKTSGQDIKKSGALLLAIDLAGTGIGEDREASGEQSLRILVNESGGRFFKGTDEEITGSLAAAERGSYELSVSLPQETPDATPALEVRAKNPDITLTGISSLARARSFAEMTPAEKQAVLMTILNNGIVGDIGLKVGKVPADISVNGEEALLSVQLPAEFSQAEWDIYKVWRDTSKGTFQMEKEHVLSESPLLTFSMTAKKNTLQSAVLVQAESGTALVCQAKNKPTS